MHAREPKSFWRENVVDGATLSSSFSENVEVAETSEGGITFFTKGNSANLTSEK